ncbi:hypothetical protein Cs7R123_43780 [Catellatospora sp. TT07R-123]|uniref:hypothetical protein n=1 Tax=Catellatospora sp. TT07R-123 TaxID=2733863 RepID=UPI001B07F03B|nr:hypothetical protein [Catellatospora sp. TT07R-123]GHJ47036.1 hypothetical protein Cs7R123_43780 [Catellatospora sp. TT07R-123]
MRPSGPRLYTLLALWLVPLFVVRTVWHLAADDQLRVVNATLVFGGDDAILTCLTAVWWTWAVLAAVAVLGCRPDPLRQAWRALPVAVTALVGSVLSFAAGFLALGTAIPGGAVAVGVVAAIVLVVLIPVVARLSVAGVVAVTTDDRGLSAFSGASRLVRGRALPTAAMVAFGVVAPAFAAAWAAEATRPSTFGLGTLHWLATDLAFVGVAAIQAGALHAAYRNRLPAPDAADAAAPGWATASRRLVTAAGGLLALSTLLAAGSVRAHRLPEVSTLTGPDLTARIAMAWPAGRHPMLIGQGGIQDCLDELCSSFTNTALGILMYHPSGSAAVAPDGSVFALGRDVLAYCDAQRHCRHTTGMYETLSHSAAEAVALSVDGELLIATATPLGSREEATQVELGLIHCRDVLCADARTTKLGVVSASMKPADGWRQQMIAVGLDHAQRPIVAFRPVSGEGRSTSPTVGTWFETASAVPLATMWVARCDTADCGHAGVAELAPGDVEELAALQFDAMLGCLRSTCGVDVPVATVARPQGGVYAIVVGPRPHDGLWLQVGTPSDEIQATLLVCPDATCAHARRIPIWRGRLGTSNWPMPLPAGIWTMAVNPDGSLLIAQPMLHPTEVFAVRP